MTEKPHWQLGRHTSDFEPRREDLLPAHIMNKERNPVGWFEIYVTDMNRAKKFYEAMLDTKLEELPSSDPSIQMFAFPMRVSDECGGTLVYFSCLDCAEDEARVADAGGQVIKSKFAIGDYEFISLISDTEGKMIGLHSMA